MIVTAVCGMVPTVQKSRIITLKRSKNQKKNFFFTPTRALPPILFPCKSINRQPFPYFQDMFVHECGDEYMNVYVCHFL